MMMNNNELVGAVANYIMGVMYYDWDGECYRKSRPCPFASFEEAEVAMNLHNERVANRSYVTLDEKWQMKLRNYCVEHDIPFRKKLRPRKLRLRRSE